MRRIASALFFLIILFLGIIYVANHHRRKIDGLSGEIYGLLLSTDTHYASNYSHQSFSKVKKGMTEKEVLSLLGEPLYRSQVPQKANQSVLDYDKWFYSRSPSNTHYRIRQIKFREGKVSKLIGYFWVD